MLSVLPNAPSLSRQGFRLVVLTSRTSCMLSTMTFLARPTAASLSMSIALVSTATSGSYHQNANHGQDVLPVLGTKDSLLLFTIMTATRTSPLILFGFFLKPNRKYLTSWSPTSLAMVRISLRMIPTMKTKKAVAKMRTRALRVAPGVEFPWVTPKMPRPLPSTTTSSQPFQTLRQSTVAYLPHWFG